MLASLLSWRHEADDLVARYEDEVHLAKLGDGASRETPVVDDDGRHRRRAGWTQGPETQRRDRPEAVQAPPAQAQTPSRAVPTPKKPKPKPVPASNKPLWEIGELTAEQREVRRAEEVNAARARQKLEEANRMAFKLAAVERPTNIDEVRAEVENEE